MSRAPSIVGGTQQTFEKWMPFLVLLLICSSLGIQIKHPAATHKSLSNTLLWTGSMQLALILI